MLKRDDLAKQFELIVKQEIINHNDSISATNRSLHSFRENIDSVSDKIDTNSAYLSSEICRINNVLEKMNYANNSLNSMVNSHINDSLKSSEVQEKIIQDLIIQQEDQTKKIDDTKNLLAESLKILSLHEERLQSMPNYIQSEMEFLTKRISKDLVNYKLDLDSRPSEALKVKSELEERLSTSLVDFDGLMKELKIFKKTVFVLEKKIENIYTLIERLKESKT